METLKSTLSSVPNYVLFLAGLGTVVCYALVRLLSMLQDAGLGA